MNVLYIAGNDIIIHPNHRSHHFIRFLEKYANRVDVVSMTRFYSGPPSASSWARLMSGLRQIIKGRVELIERKIGIQLVIRQLPARLDPLAQDLWSYLHLGPVANSYYELCIFGNPQNVFLPLLLKKRGVVRTVIYDDWDYYIGFDRSLIWKLLMKWRGLIAVSIADVVVSVGSLLAELRTSQGAKRSIVIPNGVNYQLFAEAHEKRPHPPTLIYVGMLAEEWGVDVSIRGFAQVRKEIPTARYLIISYSDGEFVTYLNRLVDELNLREGILFLGPKRYEELPKFLAEADIGVALFRPNELRKFAFPLKVVEYMAAGLAVVGTQIGETKKLICQGKSGKAIPCSSEAFSYAVIDLLSDNDKLAFYQENGKEYAKLYDWNSLFSSFFDMVNIGPSFETLL